MISFWLFFFFLHILTYSRGQDLAPQSGHKSCGGLPVWPNTAANLHAPLFSCESRQHPRSLSGMAYAWSAAQATFGMHFNGYLFGHVPLQRKSVLFSAVDLFSSNSFGWHKASQYRCWSEWIVNKLQNLVKENRKREEKINLNPTVCVFANGQSKNCQETWQVLLSE